MKEKLLIAIFEEDISEVKKSLYEGEDINSEGENGYTPLMQAAKVESIEITQLLIQNGALVYSKDHEHCTPLHIAVDASIDGAIQNNEKPGDESISVIHLLLKDGADPSLQYLHDKSALDWALEYNSNKTIEALTNEKT